MQNIECFNYLSFRHDSNIWDLYIQFDGAKFVQSKMQWCDIRFLNLLSLIKKEGYVLCVSMYYVN
jgi:hypothetical protein